MKDYRDHKEPVKPQATNINAEELTVLANTYIETRDCKILDRVYRTYKHKYTNYAHKILKNRAVAEDVCQNAFLTLAERKNTNSPIKNFDVWMRAVIRYECYRYLKKQRKQDSLEDNDVAHKRSFSVFDHGLTANQLLAALKALQAKNAECILTGLLEGKSTEEMAEELNVPLRYVRERRYRFRKHAKDVLTRQCLIEQRGKNQCAL